MKKEEKNESANPEQALQAVLDAPTQVGSLTVHPLTIGRYALLEALKSPFVTNGSFSLMNILPSAYVMTQPAEKLAGFQLDSIDELKKQAFVWADSLDADFSAVIAAIVKRVVTADRAAPQGTSGDGSDEKKN